VAVAQVVEIEVAVMVVMLLEGGRIAGRIKEEGIHSLICGHSAHLILALTIMELQEAALRQFMRPTSRWVIRDGLLTKSYLEWGLQYCHIVIMINGLSCVA
jgi:hypothetical protein